MHAGQHDECCKEHYRDYPKSRGPEVFYGYCHDTRRMRMMNYHDYMSNLQTGYERMASSWPGSFQAYQQSMRPAADPTRGTGYHAWWEHDHGKHQHGCRKCGERDCHCSCCIRDSDAVEVARCGELRIIPITLDNDTSVDRDVKLQLGAFATASGRELGWEASLSETEFKLPACGEKTVTLKVAVDCNRFGDPQQNPNEQRAPSVDECKVAYATLRVEGCLIRPLVIAVAVLPNDCDAHRAGCRSSSCCC
jgi:hypothetical protein